MGNKVTCATGNKEDKADVKAERKEKENRPTEKKDEDAGANGDAKQVATVEISRPEDAEVTTTTPDEKPEEKPEKKLDVPNDDDVTKTTPDANVEQVEEVIVMSSSSVVTSSPEDVTTTSSHVVETTNDEIREDIVQAVTIETVQLSVTKYIDDAPETAKTEGAKGDEVKTVEKYDSPEDVAKGKENFLMQFRGENTIHAVDFMRIWRNYDTDKSGYLEKKELTHFLKDLIDQKGEKANKKAVQEYEKIMMQTFDSNKDGALEMSELALLLPLEHNFLAKFPGREKCPRADFNKIFDHFDKDNSGKIGHTELLALMKDLFEKEGPHHMKVPDIQTYADGVFEVYDTNKDGTLSREELGMVLSKS